MRYDGVVTIKTNSLLASLWLIFLCLVVLFVPSSTLAQVCPNTGFSSGLWNNQHPYPRLAAVNAAYTSSDQTLSNYNELAAYDIVLSGSYLADWTGTSKLPVANYTEYLKTRNPSIKLIAFMHAYGFYDAGMLGGSATFPDMHAISAAASSANGAGGNGWWLVDAGGQRVSPWANSAYSFLRNQGLINWSFQDPTNPTETFPVWMNRYVTQSVLGKTYGTNLPYWDGFGMETDTNTPHHLVGFQWDLDENGAADNYERQPRKGKVWMDQEQTKGWNYVYSQSRAAFPTRQLANGGELWSPGLTGIDSTPDSWQNANLAMVIFLESPYYDASCGGDEAKYWSGSSCLTTPPNGGWRRMWDLHLLQAHKFMKSGSDKVFIFKPAEIEWLQQHDNFNQYFQASNAQAKYSRFLLGTAFLADAYVQPASKDALPAPWCDECGVSENNRSSLRPIPSQSNWMGCAISVAKTIPTGETIDALIAQNKQWQMSDYVWSREFAHALVLVNPTTSSQTVPVPGGEWQRIQGVYDTQHNTSGPVENTIVIQPMDAVFLRRMGGSAPPVCNSSADLNDDGLVNLIDFSIFAGQLFQTGTNRSDLNCDGTVDLRDFSLFSQQFRL